VVLKQCNNPFWRDFLIKKSSQLTDRHDKKHFHTTTLVRSTDVLGYIVPNGTLVGGGDHLNNGIAAIATS